MNEEELKEGCGEVLQYLNNGFKLRCGSFKKSPDDIACGEYNIILCPTCQARLECFQKGKLEQKKEELSFMKECGINDFKNIEEADSSGFEKEFRRLKQLQKEIGGKE